MGWTIHTKGENGERGMICGNGEIDVNSIKTILNLTKQTIVSILQPSEISGELKEIS